MSYGNLDVLDELARVHLEFKLEAFSTFDDKILGLEFAQNLLVLRRLIDYIFDTVLG